MKKSFVLTQCLVCVFFLTFPKEGISQISTDTNTREFPPLSTEVFSNDLKTQEKELKNSPFMKRFAESRLKLAGIMTMLLIFFILGSTTLAGMISTSFEFTGLL